MRFTRAAALASGVAVFAACGDGTGPRPRPGTDAQEPPPPENGALAWFELKPRVITQNQPDSIELNVALTASVDSVVFRARNSQAVRLRQVTNMLYSAKVAPAGLLFNYSSGDLHNFGGAIEIASSAGNEVHLVRVNVKDETVPTVNVTTLATGIQVTDHVVNIRHDALNVGTEVRPAAVRALYDHFGDDYNFIAVMEQVNSLKDPFLVTVRNSITGLGITSVDRGAVFGSAARLEAILHFPDDATFDLAYTETLHELAHRWMNHSTLPALASARPHWPLSSAAYGIIGWKDPATNDNLPFPFDIVRQEDGTHRLRAVELPRLFNDLELYFMGLLPADSVRTHFVFADQNQRAQVRDNGVLQGAVDSVRITNTRNPAWPTAPRQFRVATIVLSRNGLLSRDELSFFDHMAARGAQRFAVPYATGFSRGITQPFATATGERGTLITRLRTP